jgi:G3E family GTPase
LKQAEYADVVILNKDELLQPARRGVLREVGERKKKKREERRGKGKEQGKAALMTGQV